MATAIEFNAPRVGVGRPARGSDGMAGPLYPEVGVIALPIERWGPQWQTRHHVLTGLARYFHVVWVNPAREWRDLLRHPRPASQPAPAALPGFTVHDSPPWLPMVYRPRWASEQLARARLALAREELRGRGCKHVVLYLWHPSMASSLREISPDASCYHIDDEYSYAEVEQPLDPREVGLIRAVDSVFITSSRMLERKGTLNRNTRRVPNGVDFHTCSTPAPEPVDLAGVPRPRIGYAGFLKRQLDWPLLLELSSRRPDWSFVFAGAQRGHAEIAEVLERLRARPNVHLLGSKTARELMIYPQHFDVCTMPYRRDDYTKYIYPLKLHEYLASGSPAVGTRLPALEEAEEFVTLATTLAEWEAGIEHSLSADMRSPVQVGARQAYALQHDWSRMVERIAAAITDQLRIAAEWPSTTLAEAPGRGRVGAQSS